MKHTLNSISTVSQRSSEALLLFRLLQTKFKFNVKIKGPNTVYTIALNQKITNYECNNVDY